uniref:uncharacterized protein LOC120332461 n=1 Tax=Styela clava TaxID=7725 RepID=UPI00193928E3|nr:uncharacterized protein LOC120332461 [Styela clava]XP_039255645.1 uncharacterized protein LOC120332461 [Styela clava]XP_039255646.1 uncharacterized protein LOC120332461 [Styela clava]
MAMEKHFVINDTHTRPVTAIGFHPLRREIVTGYEDGLMKWWEQDGGKLILTTHEHRGWLTDFLYWSEPKLLLSSANDGYIIAWTSSGTVMDKIYMNQPIFCMRFNLRRHHFICSFNGQLKIFNLDMRKTYGHVIDLRKPFIAEHHNDVISCVICHDSRVYTAGFDGRFCIYDTTLYPGTKGLDLIHRISRAHEAGITCMSLVKDNENNTWLLTGSFDRTVKVWSQDGKLRHELETIFLHTITSLCYVSRAKTVWVASGAPHATLYDPKAGENVSEFLPTFQTGPNSGEESQHKIFKLRYNPESSQVVGTTHRRQIIVWKYNAFGCMTALKCKHPIDSVCYTKKVPMLLFSGCGDGSIYKWERLQSSHFMYSMESLTRKEAKDKLESIKNIRGLTKKKNHLKIEHLRPHNSPSSHYTYNKSIFAPSSLYHGNNVSLLSGIYVEHLDILITSSEDGNIYIWGFDEAAVSALTKLSPEKMDGSPVHRKYSVLFGDFRRNNMTPIPPQKLYGETLNNGLIMGDGRDDDEKPMEETRLEPAAGDATLIQEKVTDSFADSVTNRVAGFICKDVLLGHESCVTSFAIVDKEEEHGATYMLSGGWDRKILVWNLRTGQLHDQLRANKTRYDINTGKEIPPDDIEDAVNEDELAEGELACDGVILDIEYCKERNEYAYASSDGMVYIRDFSTVGSEMKLRNTLQGHELEITCIKWNAIYHRWISGSEDGTIRIWTDDGMSCEHILSTEGSVSTLCIDRTNGSIVAGVENIIKVYDLETMNLVQTNVGHTDSIRSIIHVLERSQYVSGSWDKSIRIWNAYKRPVRRRKPAPRDADDKASPQVKEEKKVAV